MKIITGFIITAGIFIIGFLLYRWNREKKRKKKELEEKLAREREATRQRLFDFFTSKLASIKLSVDRFSKYLDFQNGYFANYPLTVWTNQQVLSRSLSHAHVTPCTRTCTPRGE